MVSSSWVTTGTSGAIRTTITTRTTRTTTRTETTTKQLFTSSYIPTLICLRDVYLTHCFSILYVQRYLSISRRLARPFFSIGNEQSRTVHKSGILPVQACRRPQSFLRKLQRLSRRTGVNAHSTRPQAKCRSCCSHVAEQCLPRGAKSSVLRAVCCRRWARDTPESWPSDCAKRMRSVDTSAGPRYGPAAGPHHQSDAFFSYVRA